MTATLDANDRQHSIAHFRLQILKSFYELQKQLPGLSPLSDAEAAAALGTKVITLSRWENAWKDGGLEALGAVKG